MICSSSRVLIAALFVAVAAAQTCPPQAFPFRSSLLQRQFVLFDSCPAAPAVARQTFELFQTVMVYTPSHVPSPTDCPKRLVFHFRQSPTLPFIVHLPQMSTSNSSNCNAMQMMQRQIFFLNGPTRPDFVDSVTEMVMMLERMKFGSCPEMVMHLGLDPTDEPAVSPEEPTESPDVPTAADVPNTPMMPMMGMMSSQVVFPEVESILGFFITLAYDQAFCLM